PGPHRHAAGAPPALHARRPVAGVCEATECVRRAPAGRLRHHARVPPHMGAYVEAPEDIDRLLAETDPACVGLLFDTGHAYYGGATDPATLLERHVRRVVHVHCKDVRPQVIAQARNDGWSFLQGVLAGTFTVPG